MEKSSQIEWKIVPFRHFFPLKVVPLIEVLLYLLGLVKLSLIKDILHNFGQIADKPPKVSKTSSDSYMGEP
jgi:hypothetical protein